MSKQTINALDQEQPKQIFNIQRLYIKEVHCKVPNGSQTFQQEWKPEITNEMQIKHEKMSENGYEVTLRMNISAKLNNVTAFTVEICQAGVFELKGFEAEQLDQLLRAYCPNVLFPYVRQTISNITHEAGFAPLTLAPVNFEGIYMHQKEEAKLKEKEEELEPAIVTH